MILKKWRKSHRALREEFLQELKSSVEITQCVDLIYSHVCQSMLVCVSERMSARVRACVSVRVLVCVLVCVIVFSNDELTQ